MNFPSAGGQPTLLKVFGEASLLSSSLQMEERSLPSSPSTIRSTEFRRLSSLLIVGYVGWDKRLGSEPPSSSSGGSPSSPGSPAGAEVAAGA